MRPTTAFFGTVTAVGAASLLATGYLIVRGPFLGGPVLAPTQVLVALGVLFVALFVTVWAGSRLAGVGSRV
ncbi:MAG: hypothetical protein ABEJ70_06030 [Halobacteriaceae archaeon]